MFKKDKKEKDEAQDNEVNLEDLDQTKEPVEEASEQTKSENNNQEAIEKKTNCAKCVEYKAGWQRAQADYINLQREIDLKRSEWAQMSEYLILSDFIPVYENFKTAFNHHPELNADNEEHKQMKNWADGIGYIMKQFGDVLKNHGIEEIKTIGEKFDPAFHEAVGEEEKEDAEAGAILKEIEGGYKMGEKVLKPAKVIVCK
jgi:molecular chaperone GrpE